MYKKLFILSLMITSLFSQVRDLTDENFDKATARGVVVVEFWASWNDANKVTLLDEWETFDAKVYRLNIDSYRATSTTCPSPLLFLSIMAKATPRAA